MTWEERTMHERRIAVLALLAALVPGPLAGQTVQYRSPGGVTYTSLRDTGAIAAAEAALAADPGNVERILALGLAQAGRQQYQEAIATFTKGIALAPDNAVLYRWRGHRYLSIRELERARADLERGLQLDSLCYGCLYHLGIVKHVSADFNGAAEAFARALPIAPNPGERAGSIDWSWMSLSRAGRAAEARAMVERHADSLPEGNAYTRRLALYRGESDPERILTPADTSGIDRATLSYGIGNWYLVRGDTARAREWFGRAVMSGGWPAFGFIAAEAELGRMR
jgi:tetratricopeptide (TPR) repeat protein